MKSIIQNLMLLLAASILGFSALAYSDSTAPVPHEATVMQHLNDQSVVLTFSSGNRQLSETNQNMIDDLIADSHCHCCCCCYCYCWN